MSGVIERVGGRTLRSLAVLRDAAGLAWRTLTAGWRERGPHGGLVARAFLMQVWFTGIQAMPLVAASALALGLITILQTEILLAGLSEPGFVERTIVFILVRELPAILVCLILVARSGTAITTEIANMKLNREEEALAAHGVPPEVLVILPRLAAFPLASVCLVFYFVLVAVGGGILILPLIWPHPVSFSFATIRDQITATDLLLPAGKALLFGAVTSLLCSVYGGSVRHSFREVPQVATRGITASFMACMALNTALSVAAVR